MHYRQVVLVFKVLFIALVLGLFYIQIIRGNYYYRLSKINSIRVVSLEASRGKILDRNGVVLADTRPSYDIYAIPQEIKNRTFLFNRLSELLAIPVDELNRNYKKNYLNPFAPVQIYEKLEKDKVIILEESKLLLPGLIVEVKPQRYYPFNRTASHILGYLGEIDIWRITQLKPYGYQLRDLVGYGGIEEFYDLILRGKKGGEQVEVDNLARKVRTVGYKSPSRGKDIQITIDIAIQKIVDKFMSDYRGAAVIMDPNSGEIIALSSYPDYDPNDFIMGSDAGINSLLNDSAFPLLNRAIAGRYPPGSVFKIVAATAALEHDSLLLNKTFVCDGHLEIGDRIFDCWSNHGQENLRDAIVHSCNIYFYSLGIFIGPEIIKKYAHVLGLGKKSAIDLNYERNGFIPSAEWRKITKFQNWYKGDTANISIGQGEVTVTPLQLARAISVFINGAKLVRPHLLKAVSGNAVSRAKDKTLGISIKTLDDIRNYMNEVVDDTEGTAHMLEIKGLKIGGKTGTAQVSGKAPHGWFVGYAGRDKPKYSFCIFLEHGGSSYAACAVLKKILEEMSGEGLI